MTTRSLFDERLEAVEDRLRRLYAPHTEDGGATEPADPLPEAGPWPGAAQLAGLAAEGDRLAHLAAEFGLTGTECDLLLTCLLPEIIPVCGTAFRYLSGLPTSRPTVSVALAAHGLSAADALARGLLREGFPLLRSGLVAYENPEAAFPDRVLSVPDRLLDFLGGSGSGSGSGCGTGPQAGPRWLRALPPHPDDPDSRAVSVLDAELATDPHRTRYLRQGIGGEALRAARSALAAVGRVALLLDPDSLATAQEPPAQLAAQAALEARLRGAAILVPLQPPGTAPADRTDLLRQLVTRLNEEPLPLLLYGAQEWAAYEWDALAPAGTDLRGADAGSRRAGDRLGAAASAAVERLHRSRALHAARPTPQEVRAVARQRSASELGSLARHIVPEVGWPDLVLPAAVRTRLDMLVARARHRDAVFEDWGLRRGGGRGRGVTSLFAGESGTGKTMAAEVVAGELGLDLYVISLPSVVSKYIGETEKNLERIFSAADTLDAVVLFDEADSMFAKRGEVKGSNDRHANMQSGYLLQRLEAFNGLAVLTTNLRSNIDSAFTRRFDEVVHFESPGPEVRARLWRSLLGGAAPAGLPVDSLAQAYDLAGGSIRACVESAVFAAVAHGGPLTGEDLMQGIEAEYAKLGRLFSRVV